MIPELDTPKPEFLAHASLVLESSYMVLSRFPAFARIAKAIGLRIVTLNSDCLQCSVGSILLRGTMLHVSEN